MAKKNIYVPKPYKQGFGNPGKPNLGWISILNSNEEYNKFLRNQQKLKIKKK